MYMHLPLYEQITLASAALHVWHLPPDVPRAHPALRDGAPFAWVAGDAADDPASAFACRRGVSGTTWRNACDGQHKPDAHACHHGPARLDRRASRQRSARTMAASVRRRRNTTQAGAAGLGESSIASAPSAWRPGLE